MSAAAGCGHPHGDPRDHAQLAEELRRYVFGALALVEPYIEQVREAQPPAGEQAERTACASCPVCAVISVLRGGHSELAVRLAEQASGLVAVLRSALAEGMGASSAGFAGSAGSAGGTGAKSGSGAEESRGVQRIQVSRGDGTAPGAC